ncbi:MAG: transposase [Gemmataceae bacterium]|nr:transposase [Gemmataceae bacterium]
MPRTARASVGGVCYHVLNRGNDRHEVFLKDGDYDAFLKAIGHACVEIPMDVFGYCLMPNHFHLVLRPREDGDLSRWMHWLLNAHVRRYRKHHGRSGHLWQGRFKAFPIEEDEHLLTVLRYVERNPVRAKLVRRAERWLWSSAPFWKDEPAGERPSWLADPPRQGLACAGERRSHRSRVGDGSQERRARHAAGQPDMAANGRDSPGPGTHAPRSRSAAEVERGARE